MNIQTFKQEFNFFYKHCHTHFMNLSTETIEKCLIEMKIFVGVVIFILISYFIINFRKGYFLRKEYKYGEHKNRGGNCYYLKKENQICKLGKLKDGWCPELCKYSISIHNGKVLETNKNFSEVEIKSLSKGSLQYALYKTCKIIVLISKKLLKIYEKTNKIK